MLTINKKDEDFFDNPFYRLNKKYLTILGLWPYQDKRKGNVTVFVVIFCIATVVVPEVIYFVEVIRIRDMNKIIDCLPALSITYGAYVILITSITNFSKITKILENIKENWMSLKDKKESNIFEEYAEEGRLLSIFYSVLMVATLVTFATVPLLPKIFDFIFPLNESRPLSNLLEVQYFVDPYKYYVPIFLHGLQAAIGVIFVFLTMDTFYVAIVQHACSMFIVLGYRLRNVAKENSKIIHNYSNNEQEKYICDKLIECTQYHNCCIRFSDLIEDTLTISWFLQLFLNMIIISIAGVQTITRSNDPFLVIKFGLNTISIIFRLFYISWPGQKILDHSGRVYYFLCDIAWHDFPPKAKKLILFMLHRSLKPCNITAGKMICLNFETYCTLMQTSMSYFTVILSTQ